MSIYKMRLAKILKIIAFIVIAAIVITYAALRSVPYFSGPSITIFEPLNGSTIASTTVTLIGKGERINSLTLNGNPISFDENGAFKEKIIIFSGINRITFEATDQFNRNKKLELTLLGSI